MCRRGCFVCLFVRLFFRPFRRRQSSSGAIAAIRKKLESARLRRPKVAPSIDRCALLPSFQPTFANSIPHPTKKGRPCCCCCCCCYRCCCCCIMRTYYDTEEYLWFRSKRQLPYTHPCMGCCCHAPSDPPPAPCSSQFSPPTPPAPSPLCWWPPPPPPPLPSMTPNPRPLRPFVVPLKAGSSCQLEESSYGSVSWLFESFLAFGCVSACVYER